MSAVVALINRVIRLPQLYLSSSGLILLAGISLSLGDLTFVSPWLRVSVGLLVFLLPGAYLFLLFPARAAWDLIDVLGYGFVFSVALITLLGLVTRTLSLPIERVEFIWYAVAILCFATVLFRTRSLPGMRLNIQASVIAILVIVVLQTGLFAHSSLFAAPTTNDQFREHVIIDSFLRDDPLGWEEPFYETGNRISDRDYLVYWPLAQALVVEISGVHYLLARYLVNPFVVILSVAGLYIFARNLGRHPKISLAYTVLGLLGLSLVAETTRQAGGTLFVLAMLDKVLASFVLAPIAISTAYLYSVTADRRACGVFVVSFLATMCTHVMIGGLTLGVIVVWCCIRIVTEPARRSQAFAIALLTVAMFTPGILLRLTSAFSSFENFGMPSLRTDGVLQVFDVANPLNGGQSFYAISPAAADELTYILSGLLLVAAVVGGLSSRVKLMLAFVMASGIGLIPYTAWIYGRLIPPDLLVRALWLLPYGHLIGILIESGLPLLYRAFPACQRVIRGKRKDLWLVSILALAALASAHSLQIHPKVDYTRDIYDAPSGESEFLEIASIIDSNHDERVWIAASREYFREVIGLSWKVISLSRYTPFRMSVYSGISMDQAARQMNDNFSLYKADVSVADKFAIIDRYGIEYLLFPKQYSWMIDALYQANRERVELVYSGDTLRLIRLR